MNIKDMSKEQLVGEYRKLWDEHIETLKENKKSLEEYKELLKEYKELLKEKIEMLDKLNGRKPAKIINLKVLKGGKE